MKLLWAPPSPFVRKVRVVLHETGQTGDVELVQAQASPVQTGADLASVNPAGKIPALIRDEGPALYDSRVICRFLDARAGSGLYPESRLWDVLTLEATGDAMMDAGVLMIYERRARPEAERSESWVEGQWARIDRCLDALNQRWMSHLAGPLDMGHISVGCALGYLDFRHDARNWRQGRDALAGWFEGFAARDSMTATAPYDLS